MRQAQEAAKKIQPKMIMQKNPNSAYSEIYRSLRFNLECLARKNKIGTISITSGNKGEGKTTTAVNLAIATAQAGRQVVLVDANLRHPAVHLAFGVDNLRGLSGYIADQTSLYDILKESHIPNLSLITSGPLPPNPSELLQSHRLSALLAQLKQQYDAILIDTPPILNLTDAKLIATASDGVLLVVEHGKLKRAEAKKIKEDLELMKSNLLGVVVNKTKRRDMEQYLP